jgi:hypothetical protein
MPLLTTQSAKGYGFGSLVTAAVVGSYESIATLYGTGTQTVSFTSIPATYKHLEIRVLARDTGSGTDSDGIGVQFNGDTGAYYWHQAGYTYQGNNTAVGAATSALTYIDAGLAIDGGNTAGWFGHSIYKIPDYTSTVKMKTLQSFTGSSNSSNAGYVFQAYGMYTNGNSTAINRIDLKSMGANPTFGTTSRFMLFGIKG